MKQCDTLDVLVVGAGHAGCEAALAAARMGCSTRLVTFSLDGIAAMPCNPAVGGIAKGHLVREIDALGGEMGLAIDATGIQFRLLNRSKGPAVRAPRAQADRDRYHGFMRRRLEEADNLTLLEDEVLEVLVDDSAGGQKGQVRGLKLRKSGEVPARCVVVTTGTFLRGLMPRAEF